MGSRSAFYPMNSMTDDVELLRRYARDSSQDAFAELVRRHVDLVYSAALPRVGRDSHLAEDITQRVFSDLARQAGTLSIRSSLAGWLYTRARFIASDVVRSERRRRHREEQAQLMSELSLGEPSAASWDRLRPVLEQTVEELKPEDRNAVLLRFFEHRPFADIGALLGLSEDAAQKRVHRSAEKLRGLLARRGVTSTAAALALVLAGQTAVAAPAGLAGRITKSALTALPPASAPALGILQLMSTTKAVSLAAAALLVAALGIDTHEILAEQAASARLTAASAAYDSLLAELHSVRDGAAAAEREAGRRQSAQAATNASGPAAWNSVAAGKAFLARHPAVKQALIARSNALTNLRYGALYKSLGLTPAQIVQFQALMLDNMTLSINRDAGFLTLNPGNEMSQEEIQSQLSQLLGPEGLPYYFGQSRTRRSQTLTAEVAGALAPTDSALTPDQANQLTEILTGNIVRGDYDWDAILVQTRAILSAPQQSLIAGLQAEDLEQRQYQSSPVRPRTASERNSSQ